MHSSFNAAVLALIVGVGGFLYVAWDSELNPLGPGPDDSSKIFCEINGELAETDYTLNRLVADMKRVLRNVESDHESFIDFQLNGKRMPPMRLHLRRIGPDRLLADRISQPGTESAVADARGQRAQRGLPMIPGGLSALLAPTPQWFFTILFLEVTARDMLDDCAGRCPGEVFKEAREIELPEWMRNPKAAN